MNRIFTLLFILSGFYSTAQRGCDIDLRLKCKVGDSVELKSSIPNSKYTDLSGKFPCFSRTKTSQPVKKDSSVRIVFRCRSSVPTDVKPILIINGRIADMSELASINPNEIESISVLKEASAQAMYGSIAFYGAIIVTLHKPIIILRDRKDSIPIQFATLQVLGAKKGAMTNERGIAVIDWGYEIREKNELEISCVGYESVRIVPQLGEQVVYLDRSYTYMTTCTVKAPSVNRRISCGYIMYKVGKALKYSALATPNFKVYPSLVQKGQRVTIETHMQKEDQSMIRVISLDGKVMLESKVLAIKGLNRFMVQTEARWASGIYFVQFAHDAHQIAEQQKIIIQ